jgi:hypothetical protein
MRDSITAFQVAIVGSICYLAPELLPVLQEHLDDYDGLLPHVMMGDITRWVIRKFNADRSDPTLRQVLKFIEDACSQAEFEDRGIIIVSFLENLPRVGEKDAEIRSLLGPSLLSELQKID